MPQSIRATAQAIVRRRNQILVFESRDRIKNENFYRPIGGGVEFGERGLDAVAREFLEEAGLEIQNPRLIGFLENHFVFENQKGHELVQVFLCELKDPSLLERESFSLVEGDQKLNDAVWKDIEWMCRPETRFYPDGIKDVVKKLLDF